MAPAVLAFAWGLAPLGRLGWAAGFLFVTAAALASGALQHPDEYRQALFRRPAEPCRRGHRRPPRSSTIPEGLRTRPKACLGVAARRRAGAADGEHHPVPQLQDDRHGQAARLPGPDLLAALHRAVVTYPHEVLLRHGLRLPRLGVRRPRAAQAAETQLRRSAPTPHEVLDGPAEADPADQ